MGSRLFVGSRLIVGSRFIVGSRPIALAVLGSKPPNEVGLLPQKGDLLDSMRNLDSYMGIAHPSEHFAPQIYRSAQTCG